jgi:hypothetical protein
VLLSLAFAMVDINNYGGMPATIDDDFFLESGTEASNLGRLSRRSSASGPQAMCVVELGICGVEINNYEGMPATRDDENEILQSGTEASNLGRLSRRLSAIRPQAMCVVKLGIGVGGHNLFLGHASNNRRRNKKIDDENKILESGTEVSNLGRLSHRLSAIRPQAMCVVQLGICGGGHILLLGHASNKRRRKFAVVDINKKWGSPATIEDENKNSRVRHRSIEPRPIVASIVGDPAASNVCC